MLPPQSLPWMEPLDLAAAIGESHWLLLYSGVQTSYSGRYSYLACDLAERIESNDFAVLEKKLGSGEGRFDNAWFGYLGYGLKDSLEILTPDAPHWPDLPNLCMMRFNRIYCFDHQERSLILWSAQANPLVPLQKPRNDSLPRVASLDSNMNQASYLEKAAHIIERIHAGDLYQANLTRKFMGEFTAPPDAFALFRKLCAVSPAPYSAYLQLGDTAVLSSSPELFLQADEKGFIRTRPIKGTAPRFADAEQDQKSRDALAASPKDRAENLMIVDLMRNDLSRSCIAGSVSADPLFEVTSHATIHHLSSTVTGQKRPECSTLESVKACFPPGSMTGAPKITAMNLCSQLEHLKRGIYSGAIGWFGGDGSCELSVIIRTLILQGKRFEFQVGGGIVADSTPERELKEILDKSKGMMAALGLNSADLETAGETREQRRTA